MGGKKGSREGEKERRRKGGRERIRQNEKGIYEASS